MRNKYKVPKKQWTKWSELGRRMFNEMYGVMKSGQAIFTHPLAPKVDKADWEITCWNVAWTAASTATEYE